jgi:DNA-binding response OmpR family regulator
MDILLVSSDEEVAARLVEALRKDGHAVDRAGSPSDGLARATRRRPGCVVLADGADPTTLQSFGKSLESRAGGGIPVVPAPGGDPTAVLEAVEKLTRVAEGAEGGPEPAGSRPTAPAGPPTALVVDERDPHRRRTVAMLESSGWRVLQADQDKAVALALIDNAVDCVLLGPTLDGQAIDGVLRSAAIIRRAHPQPFGILVLADTDNVESAQRLIRAGADDVVVRLSVGALVRHMCRARGYQRLLRENRELKAKLAELEKGSS